MIMKERRAIRTPRQRCAVTMTLVILALATGVSAQRPETGRGQRPLRSGRSANPLFALTARQANSALNQKRFRDAIAGFDEAKRLDPVEFEQAKLQGRRVQAARGLSLELVAAGRSLMPTSLSEAKAKFLEAQQVFPESPAAMAMLEEVRRRETLVTPLAAPDKPALKTTDVRAPAMPTTRDATAAKDTNRPPRADALRDGLAALLRGDAQQSIGILEPALQGARPADKAMAPLHAYLGVAYATLALSSPKADDQGRLREQAREQFRHAISVRPDFQLSTRLVSPKIVALFEQARR